MAKQGKIAFEKATITLMIDLYCQKKHGMATRCEQCEALHAYAHKRLTYCKFQEQKTSCQKCPIHCYQKQKREEIKAVMRFSGPRLLIYRPIAFIKHMFY
ncbi:MAG: nitrous oxide-stimulated promoter family protein [Culicoidibacterales bacterium]